MSYLGVRVIIGVPALEPSPAFIWWMWVKAVEAWNPLSSLKFQEKETVSPSNPYLGDQITIFSVLSTLVYNFQFDPTFNSSGDGPKVLISLRCLKFVKNVSLKKTK